MGVQIFQLNYSDQRGRKICSHKGPNISGGVLLLQEKMDPPVQIFHNIWTGGPIFVKYLDLGVLPMGGPIFL